MLILTKEIEKMVNQDEEACEGTSHMEVDSANPSESESEVEDFNTCFIDARVYKRLQEHFSDGRSL